LTFNEKKNKIRPAIAGGAIIYKYKVVVNLEDIGRYDNFGKAFGAFHAGVKNLLTKGTSRQILETACWIEYDKFSISFYEARDIANIWELMKDGKLIRTKTSAREEELIHIGFAPSVALSRIAQSL